jgi:hypothetical protein
MPSGCPLNDSCEELLKLEVTDEDDVERLEELLYGLYALITVHFWKEDQLYLPLLERPGWPVFDG